MANVIIIHDIRSAENVGAIFRTADACGISKIYLSGVTPSPIDRFGRPQPRIAKAALGAEHSVAWESHQDIDTLFDRLHREGFYLVAIEQSDRSTDYKDVRLQKNNAFIVGSEVSGIDPAILSKADIIAEIPMKGEKESLNVSVATGVAIFRMLGI